MTANAKKNEQLGQSHSTAQGKLRKAILWRFIQRAGEDFCFQCGAQIEDIDQLSIEHKVPWLDSEDPLGIFYDLDNIAFSHLSCNVGAARQPIPWNKKYYTSDAKRQADNERLRVKHEALTPCARERLVKRKHKEYEARKG